MFLHVVTAKVLYRGMPLLLALALAGPAGAADGSILVAANPVPDAALMEMVANADYPQQSRMNAMTRVAEQATAATEATRAQWFEDIAEDETAPVVIRSHALTQLAVMRRSSPEFVNWLLEDVRDPERPAEWRIAALAHLTSIYGPASPEERVEILRVIRETAEGESGELSAAAMLSLGGLAKMDAAAVELTASMMEAVLENPDAGAEELHSAMQMALALNSNAILPLARSVAADPARELRLRLSAIGIMGEFGDESDLETLSDIGQSSPVLRKVSANAVVRLQARLAAGQN